MGQKTREKLSFIGWLLGITITLGVVCVNPEGFFSGKWMAYSRWVNLSLLCCTLAVISTFLFCYRRIRLFFFWEDFGVLLLFAWFFLLSLVHGDYNRASERYQFLLQWGMWWWVLRIGTAAFPFLARCIPWWVLFAGAFEAAVGYLQLYGIVRSNHGLFALTGTFFNPGPYSGYLAVAFTVGAGLFVTVKTRWLRHVLCGLLLLMGCLLPVGMSRSAWFAVAVGCLCLWRQQRPDLYLTFKKWGQRFPRHRIVLTMGLVTFATALCAALFYLKHDSASGRLLIWKITARMIAERPLTGAGLFAFPAAYGEAQETYFAQSAFPEWEKRVAGSPEFAFNEYLQGAAEGGIPLLLLVLFWVGGVLCRGLREGNKVSVAGIVAFGVFAFFSYPVQLPPLIALLLLLLVSCQTASSGSRFSIEVPRPLSFFMAGIIGLLGLFVFFSLYPVQRKTIEACRKWESVRPFYTLKAYEVGTREYAALYEILKNSPDYLFEYALCARHTGDYVRSNALLERALLVSGDPMILNLLGRNYEDLGNLNPACSLLYFRKSEHCLRKSAHRLPGRLYPFYLLAKLYSNPRYYHPAKAREMANRVLAQREKVTSPAVNEMRKEMRQLLLRLY